MKKFLWILIFMMISVCSLCLFTVEVNADDEVITETELTETELTEEEQALLDKAVDYVSQYVDRNVVMNIINWLLDCGFLTALLGVLVKYKKYKDYTLTELLELFKIEMKKWFEEEYKNNDKQIDKIVGSIDNLQVGYETIMKVLVLMNDSTEKGKVALLDYLGTKTNSQEIKDAANEVKQEINNNIEKKEELKEEANKDFEKINLF